MLNFINQLAGIGETGDQSTPLTVTAGLLLVTPGFQFDTVSDFGNIQKYKDAIIAGNMYPVKNILDDEPDDFADVVTKTATGSNIFQFEGKRGRKLKVQLPLELHKVLRTYSFKNWRVFRIDQNNNIIGTSPDGTVVKGIKLSYFRVGKQMQDSTSGTYTPIEMQEGSINQVDKFGVYINPDWEASDLEGVLQVKLVSGVIAANATVVTVNWVDNSAIKASGVKNSVPVTGLVAANFKLINQTGAVVVATVVESTTIQGQYTISNASLTSGSLQIMPTATQMFESTVVTLA
jgi:hypothetical protein